MPPKKVVAPPAEGSRRSTRIADKPPPTAPAPAAKKPTKKRSQSDEDEDYDKKPTKKSRAAPKSKKNVESSSDEAVHEDEEQAKEDGEAPPPGVPELSLGDTLPDITLKNEQGVDVNVRDLATEQQGVVFFLVPKADTPGCNTQACGFRDSYDGFKDANYVVYCISADTSAAQAKWQTKKSLPFPLLSDPKHVLITALGAFKAPKSTKRSHFVFEKGSGKLVEKKISVKPTDSPKDALEFIQSHHSQGADVEVPPAVASAEANAPVAAAE